MKVQTYLQRVSGGVSEQQFVEEFPHPVLVELEGQDGAAPESAMTERLDSKAIRLQSKSSRDANVYVLRPKEGNQRVLVGRSVDAAVLVDHKSVSKEHAEFIVSSTVIELKDLDSTNGTFVNNKRLDAQTKVKVRPDDTVRFGRATGFYVMDAAGFYQYLQTLQRFGL